MFFYFNLNLKGQNMKLSKVGADFIKAREGLRLKAYFCSANVLTIGYGHTGNVKQGQAITEQDANALFEFDVERFEDAVNKYVKVSLKQGQYDALVSFSFNLGVGALQKSTLLKLLNKKDYSGAALQFMKWINVNGKPSNGIIQRRAMEVEMFNGGTNPDTRIADLPPRNKPLIKSRTVIGTTLAATGGVASLGQAFLETSTQLSTANEQVSNGQIFGYVVAIVIIVGALLGLYARISDHKKGI